METRLDESFGVIPVFMVGKGKFEIFLINQHNRSGGTFWGFPKGHPEKGETGEQAALRELKEETGISLESLNTVHPFIQHYSFLDGNEMVNKTVTYYVGTSSDKGFSLDPKEVADARWCELQSAKILVTHDNNRELLDQVELFLNRD